MRTPSALSAPTASNVVSLIGSATATIAATWLSTAAKSAVLPPARSCMTSPTVTRVTMTAAASK